MLVAGLLGASLALTGPAARADQAPGEPPCKWGEQIVKCKTTYGLWYHDNNCYMTVPTPEPPPSYEGWSGHYPYGNVYWAWCNYELPWPPKADTWPGWGAMPGDGDADKGPLWYGEMPSEEDVAQAAIEAEIGTEPPTIRLQPPNAVINFLMISSTEPREAITIELPDPFMGLVTATPEYAWDFGDGSRGYGAGLPYDGTSPSSFPDYYVAHAYGELGTPTVELTVTWSVTLSVPGRPPVRLDDVVRSATTTTTIRSAWSELIGGG